MVALRIKQGQTLPLALMLRDENGAPLDATTCSFASQLRSSTFAVVATLNFVPMGGPGQAVAILAGSDTAAFAPGLLQGDVIVTSGGIDIFTKTFVVYVERAVTTP
jgi:hypothetical protein